MVRADTYPEIGIPARETFLELAEKLFGNATDASTLALLVSARDPWPESLELHRVMAPINLLRPFLFTEFMPVFRFVNQLDQGTSPVESQNVEADLRNNERAKLIYVAVHRCRKEMLSTSVRIPEQSAIDHLTSRRPPAEQPFWVEVQAALIPLVGTTTSSSDLVDILYKGLFQAARTVHNLAPGDHDRRLRKIVAQCDSKTLQQLLHDSPVGFSKTEFDDRRTAAEVLGEFAALIHSACPTPIDETHSQDLQTMLVFQSVAEGIKDLCSARLQIGWGS